MWDSNLESSVINKSMYKDLTIAQMQNCFVDILTYRISWKAQSLKFLLRQNTSSQMEASSPSRGH